MRRSGFISKSLVVSGGLLLASASVFADAPAPKWYDTIGLSGYMQGSYVGNFENSPANPNNQGRQFDTNGNTFSLNSFLLQIAKPVGDSDHYGFTVRLRTGSDAQFLPGVGGAPAGATTVGTTNPATDIAVQEAYMTYAIPSMTKLQLIAGRFVTPEGFEVVDTVSNPNFSEGLLFTYAEPISHTGIKANYTFSDKANATFGVVNGWNNNVDNNGQKTLLWQLATTPTKQITWSFQGLYGNEQPQPNLTAPAADHADTLSLDTVLGFNPTDKLTLAGQLNWGQQTHDPNTVNADGTTHWDGVGLWAAYALTSKFTESARFEVMADQNNANRFGTTFADGTTNQTVKEFTLTHKTQLAANVFNRVEYRHDWSNQAYFLRSDGSNVRDQNTISTDIYVTF